MEIDQVVDHGTLKDYLADLPDDTQREITLRVAYHAAARVMPMAVVALLTTDWARKRDLTPVAVFGAVSLTGVAVKTATPVSGSAAYAYAANTDAAFAAAEAAADAADAADAYAAAYAADAAAYAADAADNKFDVWQWVRHDLSTDGAVWPDGPPPALQQSWSDAVAATQAHPADWSIWIHWYNRILQGRDWHPEAMGEVLQKITRDDWEKGPEHINPMFDEVLGLYLAEDAAEPDRQAVDDATNQLIEATPLAEDVVFDPARQVLTLQPKDRVDEDYLSDVRVQIAGAGDIFDNIASPTNAAGALSEEIKILRRALEQNPDRPVILLRTVSRVLSRLDHKVTQCACPSPEEDANVNDFKDVLTNVQLDLIALSPEVRKYHEATKPQLLEGVVVTAVQAAQSVAAVSDAELAEVLEQESDVLSDPTQDEIAQQNALYRLMGLVARGYRAVRTTAQEGATLVKNTSIIVAGVTASVTGIGWLSSPAFKEVLTAFLKSFGG